MHTVVVVLLVFLIMYSALRSSFYALYKCVFIIIILLLFLPTCIKTFIHGNFIDILLCSHFQLVKLLCNNVGFIQSLF